MQKIYFWFRSGHSIVSLSPFISCEKHWNIFSWIEEYFWGNFWMVLIYTVILDNVQGGAVWVK